MNRADIEARREALMMELQKEGNSTWPTYEAQRARNNRMAELQAELDALPQPEQQPIGMEAGSVVIHSTLGDRLVRGPDPVSDESWREDPYLRFMHEMGQDWR